MWTQIRQLIWLKRYGVSITADRIIHGPLPLISSDFMKKSPSPYLYPPRSLQFLLSPVLSYLLWLSHRCRQGEVIDGSTAKSSGASLWFFWGMWLPSLTSSHLLSPPLTSCHLLSPPLTSSHLLSPPLTSCHLLSPPLSSLRLPSSRIHFLLFMSISSGSHSANEYWR